ncbi:hypothetical protein [Bradyrhizobium zhanjiangense]|uniref:hypothetical protein n=1 Tax=Bradyrhizobium zhanjiangense TaxID=1325107 RepID=UPI001008FD28|nr:hypothetical protein [Bradyrhizobium zhanjiangense]
MPVNRAAHQRSLEQILFTIYDEIESAWAKAYNHIQLSQDHRGSFSEFISGEEKESRTKATVDLQPWLAIFELGLEWLSYVHVALSNGLKEKSGDGRYLATWSLVGSAVSFGLSIRLLCISGFDTPARALSRSYTEALLLCLAVLEDEQMATAFVTSVTDEEVKNFWHSAASPKNLHKRIIEIERKSGLPAADIDSMTSWRREEYEILSQSSHLSYTASVLTSRTQPLSEGGEDEENFAIGIWGMASEFSHRTIHYAAATAWYFSRFSYRHLIVRQPSEGLLVLDRADEWQRKIVLGRDVLDGLVSAHWND